MVFVGVKICFRCACVDLLAIRSCLFCVVVGGFA